MTLSDAPPILIFALTIVVSAVGSALPFSGLEPALMGIAAVVRPSLLLPIIALSTVTQMAGKAVVLAGSCRAEGSLSAGKRAAVEKARARLEGRRWLQLLTILVSAAVGLPPFYIVTLACGALRLPVSDFLVAGTVGRAIRITALVMLV